MQGTPAEQDLYDTRIDRGGAGQVDVAGTERFSDVMTPPVEEASQMGQIGVKGAAGSGLVATGAEPENVQVTEASGDVATEEEDLEEVFRDIDHIMEEHDAKDAAEGKELDDFPAPPSTRTSRSGLAPMRANFPVGRWRLYQWPDCTYECVWEGDVSELEEYVRRRGRAGDFACTMSRLLVTLGLVLLVLGLMWPWIGKLGLGRLPGDIVIERENFRLYLPITTSLIVSVVLSLILYLFRRW